MLHCQRARSGLWDTAVADSRSSDPLLLRGFLARWDDRLCALGRGKTVLAAERHLDCGCLVRSTGARASRPKIESHASASDTPVVRADWPKRPAV